MICTASLSTNLPLGPSTPTWRWGAIAAKKIIAETGANPKFVFDQARRNPKKARAYEMMYRTHGDPGPMRYTCRMDDCCAIGGGGQAGILHKRRACGALEHVPCGIGTTVYLPGTWMQRHVRCRPGSPESLPGPRQSKDDRGERKSQNPRGETFSQ